ncbi:MAG: hypothetical protein HDP34_02685 [Clostridia bacterium]|nr:hypothetical protein [Clostridia bacterium]
MAEERLIDDDKDRKYKIRKNADGEEELIIDGDEEQEEVEEVGFEVPEFVSDDEEAAVMTPEQLAERERRREEEEALRLQNLQTRISKAEEFILQQNFECALYELDLAEKLDGRNGAVYALKLKALSHCFTDYTRLEDCAEAAECVSKYSTDEQKQDLKQESAPLAARIDSVKAERAELNEENEAKKSERREVFKKRAAKSQLRFLTTLAAFIVPLIIAVIFSTMMFAREDGVFLILTIVFASIAVIAFIILLVMAHKFWEDKRNLKLNERNSSTKLGRKYEAKKHEEEQLTLIYAAVNENGIENDIS